MKTLISFIGKGRQDKGGYMRTRYCLGEKKSEAVTFICKALYDFLEPEKILIIGTSGSSWIEIFTNFLSEQQQSKYSDLKMKLDNRQIGDGNFDEVSRNTEELSDVVSNELNVEFACRVYDENSENELFTTIINNIDSDEEITLDVTHGFRFTPMCALMAVQYLSYIKKSKITHIYYGWLENNLEVKPVKDLSWIIRLNQWTTAFAEYNKTNDISSFSSLFSDSDQQLKEKLNEASFKEKITYAGESIEILKNLDLSSICESEDPVLRSFAEPLMEKLSYVHCNLPSRSIFLLSRQYLESDDFMRAVIYLHETFMVRYCETGILKFDLRKNKKWNEEEKKLILSQLAEVSKDLNAIKQKNQKKKKYSLRIDKVQEKINSFLNTANNQKSSAEDPWKSCFNVYDEIAKFYVRKDYYYTFSKINDLRNAIAHGTPNDDIKRNFYKNKESMRQEIQKLLNQAEKELWNTCE